MGDTTQLNQSNNKADEKKFTRKSFALNVLKYFAIAVVTVIVLWVITLILDVSKVISTTAAGWMAMASVVVGGLIFLGGVLPSETGEAAQSEKRQQIIDSIDTSARRQVNPPIDGEPELGFVDKLVKINFTYIESYYLQTQRQAHKSFILSAFAAIVALALTAWGIGMMYYGETDKGAVAAGVGAFCELIAAVFFYLYNRTVLKMSEYHQKLVLTQNIALALKISEKLPAKDVRPKAQLRLIRSLSENINQYLSPNPIAVAPKRQKVKRKRRVNAPRQVSSSPGPTP